MIPLLPQARSAAWEDEPYNDTEVMPVDVPKALSEPTQSSMIVDINK